ncbi:23S rRNA pseudouridine(955/2504/2580) synthase RluC [Endozoicomonas montiporae]|uniref:Pseudouridine synthase n=1 Tax=Endozoicomonas montiporae CL-33 TaxID=570277 RepID=A0A142BE47_9GAMM|nr:23S rRNA pseudouridine(955/2504/2580) synthase RluC [Endozoicomonas montiporae]AMO57023.1 ribosomal large subunit pseudouridine synthase C [Endozoicomonas montiporae CL-33]
MDRRLNDSRDSASEQAYRPKVRLVSIDNEDAGQRVDNYLVRELKGVPKTRVYRIIRKGEVRVNKKRVTAAYRLQDGDVLRIPPIRVSEKADQVVAGGAVLEKLEASIIYEDDQLMIINKPSGIAVHGGSGINFGVIEAMRKLRPDARSLELVHRLDRDTSGCLMIAKRRSMLRYLHNQFQEDKVSKIYNALVIGRWPNRKVLVNAPLQKNTLQSGERMVRVDLDGKKSKTRYQVLERYNHRGESATLVEASPITGRTHQIRVHCLHAGHAILGDDKYGTDEDNKRYRDFGLKRLFLHAARLKLTLPDGTPLTVNAPLSSDLQTVLKTLETERDGSSA